jgi:hypothetical protein
VRGFKVGGTAGPLWFWFAVAVFLEDRRIAVAGGGVVALRPRRADVIAQVAVAEIPRIARTAGEGQDPREDALVDRVGKGAGGADGVVKALLFHVGQHHEQPAGAVIAGGEVRRVGRVAVGELFALTLEIDAGQGELLEVVLALAARRGLADLLHRRHQQADQNGNDGDHHEQLDERERLTPGEHATAGFDHDSHP